MWCGNEVSRHTENINRGAHDGGCFLLCSVFLELSALFHRQCQISRGLKAPISQHLHEHAHTRSPFSLATSFPITPLAGIYTERNPYAGTSLLRWEAHLHVPCSSGSGFYGRGSIVPGDSERDSTHRCLRSGTTHTREDKSRELCFVST